MATVLLAAAAAAALGRTWALFASKPVYVSILFVAGLIYWLGIWPHIVRLEPWIPFKRNPNTLFARISRYLWFPLMLMAVLAMLAVHFKWWM